jgi:hypothetical protein
MIGHRKCLSRHFEVVLIGATTDSALSIFVFEGNSDSSWALRERASRLDVERGSHACDPKLCQMLDFLIVFVVVPSSQKLHTPFALLRLRFPSPIPSVSTHSRMQLPSIVGYAKKDGLSVLNAIWRHRSVSRNERDWCRVSSCFHNQNKRQVANSSGRSKAAL